MQIPALNTLLCGLAIILPIWIWAADMHVDIARFSQGDLRGWQAKLFSGETQYVLQESDGRLALRAESNAAASGRYKEVKINLDSTPLLNWIWKVDNIITDVDERTRKGDDYAARVYVIFSGGLIFWRTRAINYVWSSNQPVGTDWRSAYTDNVHMIAVESGTEKLGQWVSEQRNVKMDFERIFNEKPGNINAVAIMTDTDNTGATVTAWYGDIWFSAR